MRSIIINGRDKDIFLFDDTLLFEVGRISTGDIMRVFVNNLEYTYTIELNDTLSRYNIPESILRQLDKVVSIFNFIIEYYRDKNVDELCVGYTGNLSILNSDYRSIFKSMGFDIPRRKRSYILYRYK